MPGIDIDPQDLAQERFEILAVALRVATRSAISGSNVKKSVRAERQHPAVVVREGLPEAKKYLLRPLYSQICVFRRDAIFGNNRLQSTRSVPSVVDEKAAIGRITGMEGQSQQAPFAPEPDPIRNFQKGRSQEGVPGGGSE